MSSEWAGLAEWWLAERAGDHAYEAEVTPLILDVLRPEPGMRYLDLGCGEGTDMRSVRQKGARVVGVDLNHRLLARALSAGPTMCGRLPSLGWLVDGCFDGAYSSLVIEHLKDLDVMFGEAARVVRPGGLLVIVANHPFYTAPGSGPIVDPADGEVFWRWGSYLDDGHTREPAGVGTVTFYHRSFSSLLNSAASAGWFLEQIVERDVGRLADDDPLLSKQRGIPRLLGVRWRRSQTGPLEG